MTVTGTAEPAAAAAARPRRIGIRTGGVCAALLIVALALVTAGRWSAPSPETPTAAAAFGPGSPQALAAVRAAAGSASQGAATFSIALTRATVFGAHPSSATASGTFDYSTQQGTVAIAVAGSASPQLVVFTPQAAYVNPASAQGSQLGGRPWKAVRFSASSTLTKNLPDFVGQIESLNPALTLGELVWGSTAASLSGPDVVDGQPATRYEVMLQPAQSLVNAPGEEPGLAQALESQVSALARSAPAGPAFATFPARAWLSESGRLLRAELSPPGAGAGTVVLTMGGPVAALSFQPPAADQVVDLSSLIPSGERENQNGGDSDGA
jgi:hypothetical protein